MSTIPQVEMLNIASNFWKDMKPMTIPREGAAAIVFE